MIYVITIIISVFFAFLSQEQAKKNNDYRKNKIIYVFLCFMSFFPSFFVASFRDYSIGTDTDSTYLSIYNLVLSGSGGIRDVGYALINKVSIVLFNNYTGLLLMTSLIMYACFYKSIFNQSKYPAISTYLFFATNVYFISMNMIRQSISISLFTLSIPSIKDRKFLKFIIINLLAFSIHSSAIIYFPTYFLLNRKLNIKYSIILVCLFGLFGGIFSTYIIELLYNSTFFLKYFAWYFNSMYNTGAVSLFSLLISLCLLIYLFLINSRAKDDSGYNLLLWLQTISVVCLLTTSFIPLMQRVSWLFSFPLFIYLPKTFDYIKGSKMRFFVKTCILGGYTLYMVMTIFVMKYHEVVPYISVFE